MLEARAGQDQKCTPDVRCAVEPLGQLEDLWLLRVSSVNLASLDSIAAIPRFSAIYSSTLSMIRM